MFEKCVVFCK